MEIAGSVPYDTVIVGGGLAGMVAGLRAAELGLRVLVLEKGEDDAYPCNSRYSGGIIHIAYRDPMAPAADILRSIEMETAGAFERPLGEALAQNGRRLIEWLRGHDIRFMSFSALETHRWCMSPPRRLVPGMDWQGKGPDIALRILEAKLVERGGFISRGSLAQTLLIEKGKCSGVKGLHRGAPTQWRAESVILADGGFQSNSELFRQNLGGHFERTVQRGAATGAGSAYMMAKAAGAATTGHGKFYGHALCYEALSNDRLWPYPQLDEILVAGLVVDGSGQRFLDEGQGGINAANVISSHADDRIFVIFDQEIWDGPGKTARIPANPLIEQVGATVYRSDSCEGLARQLGISPEAVAASVAAHNEYCAGMLGRGIPRTTTKFVPRPVNASPFMAIRVASGITYTMSGVSIDSSGRVLREDGSAIEGLFAAGSCTGGLEGGGAAGYVGGLSKAGVFGLLCAERIAAMRENGTAVGSQAAPMAATRIAGDPMQGYPTLNLVIRFGKLAAVVAAVAVAALTFALLLPVSAPLAILTALFAAAGIGVVGFLLVEVVRLVTDVLLPK